jgi:hypothetical protein
MAEAMQAKVARAIEASQCLLVCLQIGSIIPYDLWAFDRSAAAWPNGSFVRPSGEESVTLSNQ